MEKKVRLLLERLAEVEEVLGQPHVYEDQKKYRALTQEHAYLHSLKWHGRESKLSKSRFEIIKNF